MRKLMLKYKEQLLYLLFGALTTVVSLTTYEAAGAILGDDLYLVSNIISWCFAVTFAFVTNKLWVFSSKSWASPLIWREVASFVSARLFSLLIEEAGLWLLVDVAGAHSFSMTLFGFDLRGDFLAKLLMQVIVVVLNYVSSKFLIFAKKKSS